MSMKDWKTDIKIKLPRIHIIRPKDKTFVAEGIVKTWLSVTFWTSFVTIPVTGWTIWQWIKPFIENRPF